MPTLPTRRLRAMKFGLFFVLSKKKKKKLDVLWQIDEFCKIVTVCLRSNHCSTILFFSYWPDLFIKILDWINTSLKSNFPIFPIIRRYFDWSNFLKGNTQYFFFSASCRITLNAGNSGKSLSHMQVDNSYPAYQWQAYCMGFCNIQIKDVYLLPYS